MSALVALRSALHGYMLCYEMAICLPVLRAKLSTFCHSVQLKCQIVHPKFAHSNKFLYLCGKIDAKNETNPLFVGTDG